MKTSEKESYFSFAPTNRFRGGGFSFWKRFSHPLIALEEWLSIYDERLQKTGMLSEFCTVFVFSLLETFP